LASTLNASCAVDSEPTKSITARGALPTFAMICCRASGAPASTDQVQIGVTDSCGDNPQ
jgi:hypothetical protein